MENCPNIPSDIIFNLNELQEEDRAIVSAFNDSGHFCRMISWSDSTVNWNEFDIAIIRSTWDYIDRCDEFLNSLKRIDESSCRLLNTYETIKWNSDKRYLTELENYEISTIPVYDLNNFKSDTLNKFLTDHNIESAIIKPIIGGGGKKVIKVNREDIFNKINELNITEPENKFLLQPLVRSVMLEGEISFVFFNGKLSHTVLKKAASGDYRVNEIYGGSLELTEPDISDIYTAQDIMNKIPFDTLYARIDMVRYNKKLVVMELELIEPSLYFSIAPEKIFNIVSATVEKFGQ